MDNLRDLRVEYRDRPLAIDSVRPRFQWRIESNRRDVVQTHYRVTVHDADGERWDSRWVTSNRQSQVQYEGEPLPAGCAFDWRLMVRLADGGELSETGQFETAPPPAVWDRAAWITIPRAKALHEDRRPTPYLRRTFTVPDGVRRARLYATAGGIFQPWLNGEPVATADFAPGWTDYRYRVPFHTYDLKERIGPGSHTIGAILADGWYSGFLGPFNKRDFWGDVPVFRALLRLDHRNGTTEWIATDGDWQGSFGAIQASDMLHGEVYDARFELDKWSAGGDQGRWVPAVGERGPQGVLVPAIIDAAGPVAEIQPISVREVVPGSHIVDFGQNFAGRVRLTANGPAGTIIRMRDRKSVV